MNLSLRYIAPNIIAATAKSIRITGANNVRPDKRIVAADAIRPPTKLAT